MKPFFEENLQDGTNLKVGEFGMQGDVVIQKIDNIPNIKNKKTNPDNALAYGEHSGHIHQATGEGVEVFEDTETGLKYMSVEKETTVKHQEHSPIKIGPGFYQINIQKEYNHVDQIAEEVRD